MTAYHTILKTALLVDGQEEQFTHELRRLKRLQMQVIVGDPEDYLDYIIKFALMTRELRLPILEKRWKNLFYLAFHTKNDTEYIYQVGIKEMKSIIEFLEWLNSKSS